MAVEHLAAGAIDASVARSFPMKYQSIDQIRAIGGLSPDVVPASRRERLERWVKLLETQPERRLATLKETEYETPEDRDRLSAPNSPISVAFADPYFRALGMKDDTYGEARRFFDISDHRLHDVLCFCHYGNSVTGHRAAQAVRGAIAADRRAALWSTLRLRLQPSRFRGAAA